jgi:valyl-tRNA synthetase
MDQILGMLHPFMPFVTEELWSRLDEARKTQLILAPWPVLPPSLIDIEAAAEMNWLVRLVSEIRAVRSEMNVPGASKLDLVAADASAETRARIERHRDLILRLGRLERVAPVDGQAPKNAAQFVLDEATLFLPLEGVIDFAKERARLEKEIARLAGEVSKIDAKLGNADFVKRAPEEVIEEQRERRADAAQTRAKFEDALKRLRAG